MDTLKMDNIHHNKRLHQETQESYKPEIYLPERRMRLKESRKDRPSFIKLIDSKKNSTQYV